MSLLEDVIDAHGGRRPWRRAEQVRAHVHSGGLLMRSKLKGNRFRDYGISIATDRQNAIFQPFPRPGKSGVFDDGDVRILDSDGTFPEGFHTHCPRQTFYYDSRGLLRRHDYSPDVVASFANAAHLCSGHTEVDGLVFPTSRRVVPKGPGGRSLPGPTIVSIELSSIGVS